MISIPTQYGPADIYYGDGDWLQVVWSDGQQEHLSTVPVAGYIAHHETHRRVAAWLREQGIEASVNYHPGWPDRRWTRPAVYAVYAVEFAAQSIGQARDLVRQAAPEYTDSVNIAGRLGFEVTGPRDRMEFFHAWVSGQGHKAYIEQQRTERQLP